MLFSVLSHNTLQTLFTLLLHFYKGFCKLAQWSYNRNVTWLYAVVWPFDQSGETPANSLARPTPAWFWVRWWVCDSSFQIRKFDSEYRSKIGQCDSSIINTLALFILCIFHYFIFNFIYTPIFPVQLFLLVSFVVKRETSSEHRSEWESEIPIRYHRKSTRTIDWWSLGEPDAPIESNQLSSNKSQVWDDQVPD